MIPLPHKQIQDPYRRWDAAYVLGALPPSERLEYEDHLTYCSTCRTSVVELAGLPGLLARVPPEALDSDRSTGS